MKTHHSSERNAPHRSANALVPTARLALNFGLNVALNVALSLGSILGFVSSTGTAPHAHAQGSAADYERAWDSPNQLNRRWSELVIGQNIEPVWHTNGDRFIVKHPVRREGGEGAAPGARFLMVNAATGNVSPAFDHTAMGEALTVVSDQAVPTDALPVDPVAWISDREGQDVLILRFHDQLLGWAIADETLLDEATTQALQAAIESGAGADTAKQEDPSDTEPRRHAHRGMMSPDGRWQLLIRDQNVFRRDLRSQNTGEDADEDSDEDASDANAMVALTADGTPEDAYEGPARWSPDGRYFVLRRRTPGDGRRVYYVESAPEDQIQPVLHDYGYDKPGDHIAIARPVLFALTDDAVTPIVPVPLDEALLADPFRIGDAQWSADGAEFHVRYNQRGHQRLSIVAFDAATGTGRRVIDETRETFIDYSQKSYFRRLHHDANTPGTTGQALWMSERSGWNHLYRYDWATGEVINAVTSGEWVVREVERLEPAAPGEDPGSGRIWFWAMGVIPGQDPYYRHLCRVNLDGTDFQILTADPRAEDPLSIEAGWGTHEVQWSPDRRYLIDTFSRIDTPEIHVLRDARDGRMITMIDQADASALDEVLPHRDEPFVAKGRDGITDIYGVIVRPTHFDPSLSYPVIEYIYAGPHNFFVRKDFGLESGHQIAELGFIVVRIDGMGTNWRSKAFHDVAWRNLGDAGFEDRIAWMQAAAASRPWMDLERVGIFGGSAGGQNAMRAVIAHSDFYDAAAADCGCHDNRMDKIWWNEAWMGRPTPDPETDPAYIASSNVAQAHRLGGALLLTVGEADRNVDPASTMQVVDALIEADKDFELIIFPGAGHGAGSSRYGRRRMFDFFVRELHGVAPRWTDEAQPTVRRQQNDD